VKAENGKVKLLGGASPVSSDNVMQPLRRILSGRSKPIAAPPLPRPVGRSPPRPHNLVFEILPPSSFTPSYRYDSLLYKLTVSQTKLKMYNVRISCSDDMELEEGLA